MPVIAYHCVGVRHHITPTWSCFDKTNTFGVAPRFPPRRFFLFLLICINPHSPTTCIHNHAYRYCCYSSDYFRCLLSLPQKECHLCKRTHTNELLTMFVLLTADSIVSSGLQLALFVSTASLACLISPPQLGPQPTRDRNANVKNNKACICIC
jgi:hypothetical protein